MTGFDDLDLDLDLVSTLMRSDDECLDDVIDDVAAVGDGGDEEDGGGVEMLVFDLSSVEEDVQCFSSVFSSAASCKKTKTVN